MEKCIGLPYSVPSVPHNDIIKTCVLQYMPQKTLKKKNLKYVTSLTFCWSGGWGGFGGVEPIPAIIGERRGTFWTGLQPIITL